MRKSFIIYSKNKKQLGTSIIEFIVYITILSLLSAVSVMFLANIMRSYAQIRIEKNLSENGAVIFERIFNEARHAKLVYVPTTASSQLSLRTPLNPPLDETFTYVDYYLDNGVVWEKRESNAAIPISGSNVIVSAFNIARFFSGSAEGIRLNLTLTTPLQNSVLTRTFSWIGSTTLRGN